MNKKETQSYLMKKISDHKQTMWIGIIISILFYWTIIVPIIGIIMAFVGYNLKTNKQIELELL